MADSPPHCATVHASPLALVHVGAHGAGQGEAQTGRRLLGGLVGAAQVHGKDVLGQSKGEQTSGYCCTNVQGTVLLPGLDSLKLMTK